MQPIIQIKNLDITYNLGKENEYKATKSANMDIYPEEYIAFFGPSGCGKSTLFYCILGILAPSAGELLVKGENPYKYSTEQMIHFQTKTIGIIYQAFYLINSLSVVDNVSLPLIFHNVNPAKRRTRALELLKRFDIEEQSEKYADNLSGGQCQRVSVARALVNNPDIILADEPTGNLDSTATKQVMEALEEINVKDKKTVIIITHNAAQLVYAHRVFYMKDGKVLRVVPNPDKKQIAKYDKQKFLVTEMDYLQKIHPYLTPKELKVKSLVNYLTQDLGFDQLAQLEKYVNMMVERKLDKEKFTFALTSKMSDGGVELSKSLAEVMGDKIHDILYQSEDILRYRRRLRDNQFYSKEADLIQRLTKYLIQSVKVQPTPQQLRALKENVYNRVSGVIRKEVFFKSLIKSVDKGGVGLGKSTARLLTNYFEKIIIQGVEEAQVDRFEGSKFKDKKMEWVEKYLAKHGRADEADEKKSEKKDDSQAWAEKYMKQDKK